MTLGLQVGVQLVECCRQRIRNEVEVGHLQAKCHAVPARGGQHTVVLVPALAGMLAHEAMGHPCEADIALGGAITANPLG